MQNRFKQLLEEKNLTATRFASLIQVNASAMSHILNGRSKPGFDVLDKIGQAFPEINLNWLICGKGTIYNTTTKSLQSVEPKKETKKIQSLTETKTSESDMKTPISVVKTKKLKRIILFFEDGSFEDYEK